jgi:hypothetical protein
VHVSDLLVEVRDRDLARVAQIASESLDLSFTLRDSAVGEWQLRLPAEHPAVAHLRVPGAGVVVTGPDGVRAPAPPTTPTVDADLADPTGIVTIAGVTDEALLWARLAYPTPAVTDVSAQTEAYDVRTGPAETVMLDYVRANLAPVTASARRVDRLVVPVSRRRGPAVTKSARFDVLGDLLRELGAVANLRFRVVQVDDTLAFEVLDVADRHATVRFDLVNGTLASQQVATSPPAVTRAVVAGQGEGVGRTIIERSTDASREAEDLYGPWGRIERFVDQRSTEELSELEQAGDKVLGQEGTIATAVRAVPSDDLTMRFAADWNVGDEVTVVVGGQETRSTITEVTVLATSSGVRVGTAIGDVEGFDPRGALGKQVTDTVSRVSALERTAEQGGVLTVDDELVQLRPNPGEPVVQIPTLPYLTRTGVVEPYYTQGNPRVVWHGDSTASGPFRYVGGWRPVAGQEVLGTRSTRTGEWVVGPVSTPVAYPPTWFPLSLQNGWSNYEQGYSTAAFTRTATGLVVIKGLLKGTSTAVAGGTVIARLPERFRPSTKLMFAAQNSGASGSGAVDVRPDGVIAVRNAVAGWTSLDNIAFWPADAAPDAVWTTPPLENDFRHYVDVHGGGWSPVSYFKDPFGVVWERGIATRTTIPAAATSLYTSPSGYRAPHIQHRRTTSNDGHAYLYKIPAGGTAWGVGPGGATYISLDGIPYVDAGSPLAWTPLTYANGWSDYGPASYSPGAYTKTPDGIVHLRGLIRGGAGLAIIANLPVGFRPSERLLLGTVANQETARVDVTADGSVVHNIGSNVWFSLDGLCFVADQ